MESPMAELDTETAAEVALWEERLVILEGLVADGTLIAMHGGTSLQFRSLADIFKAIGYAKRKIRKLTGSPRGPAYILQCSKGL